MTAALFTLAVIVIFVFLFKHMMKDRHRSSSGLSGLTLGATDELLNQDKKRAAEEVVQQQAGERKKADHSGDKAE